MVRCVVSFCFMISFAFVFVPIAFPLAIHFPLVDCCVLVVVVVAHCLSTRLALSTSTHHAVPEPLRPASSPFISISPHLGLAFRNFPLVDCCLVVVWAVALHAAPCLSKFEHSSCCARPFNDHHLL